jgi:8-oxo-dGTP pyrophosphatase MutT (NUDIX family)
MPAFTIESIRQACLQLPTPREPLYAFHTPEVIKPSALIIPIVDIDGSPSVILTKRPATMRNHAGDWVFPGGRIDPGVDVNAAAAALRELEEELGVPTSQAKILGELDSRGPTMVGHIISVFVGVIESAANLLPDPHEVSEVAIVALRELADPKAHYVSNNVPDGYETTAQDIEPRRLPVEQHFFKFGDGQIVWGTQGEILWDLLACMLGDRQTVAQLRS